MNLKRFLAATVAGLGLVGLVGCGGSKDASAPPGGDGQATSASTTASSVSQGGGSGSGGPVAATVEIRDFKFSTPKVEVSAGSAVQWVNRDAFRHTVTSGDATGLTNVPDGRFDEEMPKAGSEAVVTFSEPGRYTYYCRQHNSMNAEVTVT